MPRSSKRMSKKQVGCSMKGGDASGHAISTYGGIGEQSTGTGNLIKMKGGDASSHAISTYGGIGEQSTGTGNLIKMKGGEPQPNSPDSEVGTPFIKGGYRNKSKSPRRGGSLSGLFVPAALLYGQQMAIRRSKKRGGSKRTKTAKRKH